MTNYKLAKPIQIGGYSEAVFLLRTEGHLFIPFDPANTDYAEYLKWVEAGNTPLPADTPTPE
jgi:hypothetical protein